MGVKTADVTLRLTPKEMTRGWTKQTKPRTPKECLSFETLLDQLKADAKKKLEEAKQILRSNKVPLCRF